LNTTSPRRSPKWVTMNSSTLPLMTSRQRSPLVSGNPTRPRSCLRPLPAHCSLCLQSESSERSSPLTHGATTVARPVPLHQTGPSLFSRKTTKLIIFSLLAERATLCHCWPPCWSPRRRWTTTPSSPQTTSISSILPLHQVLPHNNPLPSPS
jgi:hypothetical protein